MIWIDRSMGWRRVATRVQISKHSQLSKFRLDIEKTFEGDFKVFKTSKPTPKTVKVESKELQCPFLTQCLARELEGGTGTGVQALVRPAMYVLCYTDACFYACIVATYSNVCMHVCFYACIVFIYNVSMHVFMYVQGVQQRQPPPIQTIQGIIPWEMSSMLFDVMQYNCFKLFWRSF